MQDRSKYCSTSLWGGGRGLRLNVESDWRILHMDHLAQDVFINLGCFFVTVDGSFQYEHGQNYCNFVTRAKKKQLTPPYA